MTSIPNDPIAWRPSPELVAASHLHRFMTHHGIATLDELHRRSTTDISWFWDAVLKDLGIRFHRPYSQVVDLSGDIQWPRWCVGGEMNIVANLLDRYEGTEIAEKPAIKWEGEDGAVRVLSYHELNEEVNRMASALRSLGLGRGDVIGILMPMVPEIVVAMLAIIKIGGIFLPLFSGYGAGAISQRLNDAGAKALFTADGFRRRGKPYHLKTIADEAVLQSPTIQHIIVFHHLKDGGATSRKQFHNPDAGSEVLRRAGSNVEESGSSEYLRTGVAREQTGCETDSKLSRDHWWHELIANAPTQTSTEITGADETMMILYTSGTTGKPKGAVHTHCGFPIKSAQDMLHGFDLHQDETLFWVTDMGWMMGPWLVFGTLLVGATMVLYDGALDYPGPGRLWQLVERHRVTTLGISPTLIRLLMQTGEDPVRAHDVSSLQKFGSTGEPWNPEPWNWLFDTVGGKKLPILNYSGGTEISGGILCGNVLTPIKPCAFAGPLPGMAADVVDETGASLRGAVGELAIREPWIGMTRGFWNDPDRYLAAYWQRIPNLWVHGDWAEIAADGNWYIVGRSDDTIKVAGKRLGPAEVESILVAHPAVVEAAAIGVPDDVKGQALVCFCVLRQGMEPSDALRNELKTSVAEVLGKPLTPSDVRFVSELPKTRNAKVMRRVIRAAWLREDLGDVSSLENARSVDAITDAK